MSITEKKEIKYFIIENTWLIGIDKGWGNGYVCVPKGHKAYGKDYDEASSEFNIDAHGGLTFSAASEELTTYEWKSKVPKDCQKGYWIFGFDTAHYQDSSINRPKEWVEKETLRLKEQFETI